MPVVGWVVIGLLVAVVVLLALGGIRLRALTHRVGSFECDVRPANAPTAAWTQGIAHYGVGRIDWWRLWSVSVRPACVWTRNDLAVTDRAPLDGRGRPDLYLVRCSYRGTDVELSMSASAYAGLASWLESAPPDRRIVV